MQPNPPTVFYYRTSAEPEQEALRNLLIKDDADLTGNTLGLLVQMPPEEFLGVARYDYEVFLVRLMTHLQKYATETATARTGLPGAGVTIRKTLLPI